ncbi:hypothetical protein MMC30_001857 [Trapelia coarctata]|nr:hypothetical protein [Trapelia coarctata]
MFKHTNPLCMLLYISIVLPCLALTHSPPFPQSPTPLTKRSPPKAQCYTRTIPTDIAAKLDCRSLIKDQVLDGPGPFASTTAWKEAKDPNGNAIWSVSSPSCAIGFLAPPEASPREWTKYREGILDISRTCAEPQGLGGTVTGFLPGQPEGRMIWITQTLIAESRFQKNCLKLLFSNPGSLTEAEKRVRKSCYQMIGATVFLGAAPVAMYTNRPLGIFLFAGGGFLASQARGNRETGYGGLAGSSKRPRGVDGKRTTVVVERAVLKRERRLAARNGGGMVRRDGGAAMGRISVLKTSMMAGEVGGVGGMV